ncbi:MAG: hypothetical protein WAN22_05665 [Solirubrobacteraceae bacterium]
MSEAPVDVMAGERARTIRAHPDAVQRVPDPTDPRADKSQKDEGDLAVCEDPTDPRYGELIA